MANESTSTTWTSRILTEHLLPVALAAHTPKNVIQNLVNTQSIDGMGTTNAKVTQHADIGAASDLTENTDLTANTELTYETPISITPSEIGLKATITRKAIRRAMPGVPAMAVADAIQSGDISRFVGLIAPKARQMLGALDEKVEDTLANLLSGSSNTVGSTGVDLTSAVMINAQYTIKTLETPHEDFVYVLTPNQVQELQLEQAVVANGTGAVWYQQGDLSFFNFAPDVPRNGYRGTFMGIPIFEYSHSLRTLMNASADVAGSLMCRGSGPVDSGQPGSFALVEGAPPIFDLEGDGSLRAAELVLTQEVAGAETDDANAVTIVSDAP